MRGLYRRMQTQVTREEPPPQRPWNTERPGLCSSNLDYAAARRSPRTGPGNHNDAGFTLVELLITIAIMVLTLFIGIPSFQEFIQDGRLATQANEFVTDLNLTRSEAIKRGSPVTLCKRNSAGTDCDSSAAWLSGWIIFTDDNSNGAVDVGESILRIHDTLTGLTNLNFTRNRVTYDASGFAAGYTGTLSFCDSRGVNSAKGLVLANTGRVRAANRGTNPLSC